VPQDARIGVFMPLVAAHRGKRILDVGCFDGHLSERFKALGLYVVGIDGSKLAVERARSRTDEAYYADLDRLPVPLPDAYVDGVFAGEVLEHLFRTEEFLEEMARLTRPGGFLILTTPNLASWINRMGMLFGWQPLFTETGTRPSNSGNPLRQMALPAGHIRVMTAAGLRDLLERSGWKVEKFHGAPLLERPVVRTLDRLVSRFFPSLASDLIAVCKRA